MNAQNSRSRKASGAKRILMGLVLATTVMVPSLALAAGPLPVNLGTASHFAILAGSAITSTGGGSVTGDVGLSPTTGAGITGTIVNNVHGIIYVVDEFGPAGSVNNPALLTTAMGDVTTAYNDAAGRSVDLTVGTQLGGTTRTAGVYTSAAGTFGITGILTLNAGGDPNAVFIFKMASTLITATGSQVKLINGAQAKNIFWQVGSSATLGSYSDFKGTIMADQSITIDTSSTVEGRAFARIAQITFNGREIDLPMDYTVVKTVSTPAGGAAQVGDPVIFQITIANTGGVTLASVPVEDRYLTNILSFVSATPSTVDSVNDGTINWTDIGPLAPGASVDIFVSFLAVGSTAGQWVTNMVVVSPTNAPVKTNTAPYSTTDSTNNPGYILGKAVTSPLGHPAQVGERIVFQITVANTGNVTMVTVPLQDLYSTNILAFVSSTHSTVDTTNDGILDWADVGPLAPGASTNISVTFTAVRSTAGQPATNVVVAFPTNMPVSTKTAPYSTGSPGYTLAKTVTSPPDGAAPVGESVVFQIRVVNTGDVTLATVPVEDRYSTNILAFVSATLPPVNAINDGILNWANVGPVAPGATNNMSVTFRVVGGTAGLPATNVVVASPAGLPVTTNTAAYSTIRPAYTLAKTVKSPVGGAVLVDKTVVFRITVSNTGDVALPTMPVEDRYSTNILAFVSTTSPTVNSTNDGIMNWANVGPLAPGASTNISVTFMAVGSTAGKSVTNLVVAAPTNLPALTNGALYRVNSSPPLPVELKSFSAAYDGNIVLVNWETGVELNNLGFNVYRSANVDGPMVQVNGNLIPGQGTSPGSPYQLRDSVPDPALTYYYWLEDVSWQFVTQLHGPVAALGQNASSVGSSIAGPAPINLGSCSHFAILAHTTITSGPGMIYGDVGLSPHGSQGIPPAQVVGTIYNGGPIAAQAQLDLTAAYNAASPAALPGGIDVGNGELGGRVLAPGVYQSAPGSYGITLEDLTLDGGPNDVWVFQMASTLTVGVGRKVILAGGAQAKNVFWQVGSSATLNVSSVFKGTIMAYASITMNASSTIDGRALARVGAVTWGGSAGSLPAPEGLLKATTPFPTNGATAQAVSTNLSWQNGGGAISYDVYLGTKSGLGAAEFRGNHETLSLDPVTLLLNTTYYWRVDARNATGTALGDVWSFTTGNTDPLNTRLIWQAPTGQATCWFMNTNGTYRTWRYVNTVPTSWKIRGVGDIDDDGIADLIWQAPAGQAKVWFMSTNGTRRDWTYVMTNPTPWQIRGAGDIDSDGTPDLIWQAATGQATCWFMNKNTNGTCHARTNLYTGTTSWKIRGAGDIDGDDIADVIWQAPAGQATVWFMRTNGQMRTWAYVTANPTPWQIRGVGDIDQDGIADLIWQAPNGQATCWFMKKNTNGSYRTWTYINTNPTLWQIRGAGK